MVGLCIYIHDTICNPKRFARPHPLQHKQQRRKYFSFFNILTAPEFVDPERAVMSHPENFLPFVITGAQSLPK